MWDTWTLLHAHDRRTLIVRNREVCPETLATCPLFREAILEGQIIAINGIALCVRHPFAKVAYQPHTRLIRHLARHTPPENILSLCERARVPPLVCARALRDPRDLFRFLITTTSGTQQLQAYLEAENLPKLARYTKRHTRKVDVDSVDIPRVHLCEDECECRHSHSLHKRWDDIMSNANTIVGHNLKDPLAIANELRLHDTHSYRSYRSLNITTRRNVVELSFSYAQHSL